MGVGLGHGGDGVTMYRAQVEPKIIYSPLLRCCRVLYSLPTPLDACLGIVTITWYSAHCLQRPHLVCGVRV